MTLPNDVLEGYRTKLLEIRSRTRPEIQRMMETVLQDAQALGEHDQGPSESIDKELVLEHTEESLRSAATEALARIDAGTYGLCESCHRTIPRARLDAVPHTAYCINCEKEREQAS